MIEKEIFSSTDESVVSRLCEIFNDQRISFSRKDGGTESYLNIVNGEGILSQKKIFVNQDDYERARKLLKFLNIDEIENEVENGIKALKVIPIEDEFGYGKYHTLKVILGILIGTTLSLLLIFFIIQIIVFVLRR